MKQILLCMLACLPVITSLSQPTIKNSSFENWTVNDAGNTPNDWYCDSFYTKNEYVKKITGGSQGTYSIQLGSFATGGQTLGSEINYYDTLLSSPGNLLFDYKVFNSVGFSGLIIRVYLYDKDDDYIDDYAWASDGNNSDFTTGTLKLPYPSDPAPAKVRINVAYFNANGQTNEYAVVDNFRFDKRAVTGITSQAALISRAYPNPASDILYLESDHADISHVQLIGIDGKTIDLTALNSSVDVSNINSGVYTMVAYDYNSGVLGRQIISIIH
jgi:hypothetical protein